MPINPNSVRFCRASRRASHRGAALAEFALVAPLFFLLMFGIIQFSLTSFTIAAVNSVVREAARYGSVHPKNNDMTQPDSIQAYAKRRASGGVVPSRLTIAVNYPPTKTIDDEGMEVTRPNTKARGDKISITATYPMFSILPGMSAFQISKTSTMRIEVD